MYFVSKTLAEQEAWKYSKEHNIDFVSIIPPLVVGPFLMPSMPPSLITALSLITGILIITLQIKFNNKKLSYTNIINFFFRK